MLERSHIVWRRVCLALGALIIYQGARIILSKERSTRALAPITASSSANSLAAATLPAEIAARIESIRLSETLGQIIRPLPMALLGIAGLDVLLRGPNGQTGLLREGEELGGVKLLRIGTNRVLIQHENQTKELTLFSGFGSLTLLPKETPQ